MNRILILIILILAALVVYLLFRWRPKNAPRPSVLPPPRSEADKPEVLLSPLVDLRLRAALEAIPPEIIKAYDAVLDQLVALVPLMLTEHSNEELTVVLKFIVGKHMPGLMDRYLALHKEQRTDPAIIADTVSGFAAIEHELVGTIQVVRDRRLSDFAGQVRLLRARFGGNRIDA